LFSLNNNIADHQGGVTGGSNRGNVFRFDYTHQPHKIVLVYRIGAHNMEHHKKSNSNGQILVNGQPIGGWKGDDLDSVQVEVKKLLKKKKNDEKF